MKKCISLFLFLVMLFSMTSTAFAAESPSATLESIAHNTLQVTKELQDSGAEVTTYNNLPAFVSVAREQCPDITDLQLANFIVEYVGQDSAAIPDNDKLDILTYKNISTSISYAKVTKSGEFIEASKSEALISPLGIDTSSDGYMQLNTGFGLRAIQGSEKFFSVWVAATWLKWPAVALTDVLVLGTTGTFDDSFAESGYVHQTFQCVSGCTKNTFRNRQVSKTNIKSGDLTLKYANFTPYIEFSPISPRCDYCGGGAKDKYFRAYVRYGVSTTNRCNIQASYGHKTVGIGNISVGISTNGVPSISASLGKVTVYNGRPVTVK